VAQARASSVRERKPRLRKTLARWCSIVFGLRNNLAATSRLDSPLRRPRFQARRRRSWALQPGAWRTRPLSDSRRDVTGEAIRDAPDRLVAPLVVRNPGDHSGQGDQT
jgi:hypothetical protein